MGRWEAAPACGVATGDPPIALDGAKPWWGSQRVTSSPCCGDRTLPFPQPKEPLSMPMLTQGRAKEVTTSFASPKNPGLPNLHPRKHHSPHPAPPARQPQRIPITLMIGGVGWGGLLGGQAESPRAGSCCGAACDRAQGMSERWGSFRATSPIKGKPRHPSQPSCFDSTMPGNPANLNIIGSGSCWSSHPACSPF